MKLHVVEYKPPLKVSILASILSTVFIVIAVSGYPLPEPLPLFVRIIVGILGFTAITACVWNFTVGRRLARNLKVLSKGLRFTESKTILPHPMKITLGKLILRKLRSYPGSRASTRIEHYLEYVGDVKETLEIDLTDAKIDVSAIVDEPYPRWVVLLVF